MDPQSADQPQSQKDNAPRSKTRAEQTQNQKDVGYASFAVNTSSGKSTIEFTIAETATGLERLKQETLAAAADIREKLVEDESSRRIAEEEARKERQASIEQEAAAIRRRTAASDMRWSTLEGISNPEELKEKLAAQQAFCRTIEKSKDRRIGELVAEEKRKDENYVQGLKRQSEIFDNMVFSLNDGYRKLALNFTGQWHMPIYRLGTYMKSAVPHTLCRKFVTFGNRRSSGNRASYQSRTRRYPGKKQECSRSAV
eukprot:GHVT01031763.1.p3 GENE.GHVT01031763.1~~GHVT01031763.1.p3  ORF type:complete len:256 (-),score=24.97 GHVT01031763.1:3954-4721(-)